MLRRDLQLSTATIEQHFETFLHTYVPTRGRKGEVMEDNLDCPLVDLELIIKTGERPVDCNGGRGECIYAFRREPKPEITPDLFLYCLNDFCEALATGGKKRCPSVKLPMATAVPAKSSSYQRRTSPSGWTGWLGRLTALLPTPPPQTSSWSI